MSIHQTGGLAVLVIVGMACTSCRSGGDSPPPPDARRPQLQSKAELAAERQERIDRGEVVVQAAPMLEAERRAPSGSSIAPARRHTPGPVQSDILFVNRDVLTVAEVLYPLRERIVAARTTQTPRGLAEQLRRWVRLTTQQEIGTLLVYERARAELSDQQIKQLEDGTEREIDNRAAREFGASVARLTNHLEQYGLSLEQYRAIVERQIVVRSYTREMLLPQVTFRRGELLEYYRENIDQFSSPETRELLMIEVPYAAFLPEGQPPATATRSIPARAKLQAKRHARAAHEALATRDFADVATEYSRGLRAAQGGSWGPIGRPLQAPYDEISALIFEFAPGQHSEPVEMALGWYIVCCGQIVPATERSFVDAQEAVRNEMTEEVFGKLASDYIFGLAERATVSNLKGFIDAAVRRGTAENWPHALD